MKPLEDISDALSEAKRAKKILDMIWQWHGPYGVPLPPGVSKDFIRKPEAQKLILAMGMPREILRELEKFYDFDDGL